MHITTLASGLTESLVGCRCLDDDGNEYEVADHYGGCTSLPEMVNLVLIQPNEAILASPLPYIGAMNRKLFDTHYKVTSNTTIA